MREQRKERDEDEPVPNEVDPLDVELADDPLSVGAGKMEQMDLDHLGDVLEEVRGLANRKEAKQCEPWCRDEPIGVTRRARGHP